MRRIVSVVGVVALVALVGLFVAGCGDNGHKGHEEHDGDKAKPEAEHEGHDHGEAKPEAEHEGHEGSEAKPEAGAAKPAATEIAQKTCPVMAGNPINKDLYVDHNGRRVYFCCQMCVGKFKKDPAKYVKKLDEQLKAGTSTDSEPKSHEGHGSH